MRGFAVPGIFLSAVRKDSDQPLFSPHKNKPSQKPFESKKEKRVFKPKFLKTAMFVFFLLAVSLMVKGVTHLGSSKFHITKVHPDFLGRKNEMLELKNRLVGRYDAPLVAVCGESGIGKTELAIAWAHEYKRDFSFIFWIDGSNQETIDRSYTMMAEELEIHDADLRNLKWKVHKCLERKQGKPWLLIFDDVKSVPQKLPSYGGSILLTCRDRGICSPDSMIELQKNPKEALLLFQKLTGEKVSNEMIQLLEELDFLPLLINFVGHYIAETPGFDVSKYSRIFHEIQETTRSPFRRMDLTNHYPRSLETTYTITMNLLREKEPIAYDFIRSLVFLHSKDIPIEYLSKWIEHSENSTPSHTQLIQGDILRELQNHSLIRFDPGQNSFSIHRLLQKVLLIQDLDRSIDKCLTTLQACPSVRLYNPVHEETISSFQRMLPHCLQVLEHVKQPQEVSIRLAVKVGRYFLDTACNFPQAEKYLNLGKSWAADWDHPIGGRIAFLLGMLKHQKAFFTQDLEAKRQEYESALSYFQQAYDIFLQYQDPKSYEGIEQNPIKCTKEYQQAICLQFQGQTLKNLGFYEEAEEKLSQALKAFEPLAINGDHFDIARIYREQGYILAKKGEYDQAIDRLKEAIAMQKRAYGFRFDSQPSLAATYNTLGDILFERGDFQAASHAYDEAIEINQRAYKTNANPFILILYQKKREVYRKLELISFAEEMDKKCQEVEEKLSFLGF